MTSSDQENPYKTPEVVENSDKEDRMAKEWRTTIAFLAVAAAAAIAAMLSRR